ncbi:unnamed protein product [Ectocarpus sp. 4 AP-2014]
MIRVYSDVKYRPWGPPYCGGLVRQRRSRGRGIARERGHQRESSLPSLDSRCPAQGGLMCA